mmetsp:Transcript_6144/g.14178  ORF Transcript_6144/g.14178 Transcript_6144/m.14178 type:complete len:114 (-) Transcript_6144:494-835(-)
MSEASSLPPAAATQPSTPENPLAGLGLPQWLEQLMAPGVGQGVFTTLKLSLICLVGCLLGMLYFVNDPDLRLHLYIFLGMACVLLVLVLWFVGELQSAQAEKMAREAKEAKKE